MAKGICGYNGSGLSFCPRGNLGGLRMASAEAIVGLQLLKPSQ
jgi:hypothetical protein